MKTTIITMLFLCGLLSAFNLSPHSDQSKGGLENKLSVSQSSEEWQRMDIHLKSKLMSIHYPPGWKCKVNKFLGELEIANGKDVKFIRFGDFSHSYSPHIRATADATLNAIEKYFAGVYNLKLKKISEVISEPMESARRGPTPPTVKTRGRRILKAFRNSREFIIIIKAESFYFKTSPDIVLNSRSKGHGYASLYFCSSKLFAAGYEGIFNKIEDKITTNYIPGDTKKESSQNKEEWATVEVNHMNICYPKNWQFEKDDFLGKVEILSKENTGFLLYTGNAGCILTTAAGTLERIEEYLGRGYGFKLKCISERITAPTETIARGNIVPPSIGTRGIKIFDAYRNKRRYIVFAKAKVYYFKENEKNRIQRRTIGIGYAYCYFCPYESYESTYNVIFSKMEDCMQNKY